MKGTLIHSVKDWLNAGLAFFYPEVCQLCGQSRARPAEGFVCSHCRSLVRTIKPPFCDRCGLPFQGAITEQFECSNCRGAELYFRSARSAVVANGQVLEAIHRYKYQRALWFEPFLAGVLIAQAQPALALKNWDWVVPIPLHPTKKREREFNQAERLGKRLGAALGLPVNTTVVQRVLPTRSQTLLSREERRTNVGNAFAMRRAQKLDGQRIILVDDVFTTGATTSACAKVLLAGGASEVCVWTVARGI